MATMSRSYSSVISEDPSTVPFQVFKLIRDGKSTELGAYLCERQYARNLLTFVRTNPWSSERLSLLMIATLDGHDLVVREIISHSPNRTKMIELEGRILSASGDLVDKVTALWCALDRAHFTVAHTLIDVGKANVNNGPIHPLLIDATIRKRLDIVQFLIENGYADVNQTKTDDGNTALAVAAMEGHLESVWLLVMAGASSRTKNLANKTPIVLATENNKFHVVDVLFEHDHDNASFDDLELAVASHILSSQGTENYKSQWVIESLRHSLAKRIELNIPKNICEVMAGYNYQQECQTIDELNQIENNDDRLYIEALLIQERILLHEKDEKLFIPLFNRATSLVEKGQNDRCLDLISHIFDLSQQFPTPNYFKEFFWLFYDIFNSKISIPVDRFWLICDLIFKPSQSDHKRDESYLLEAILKVDPPEIPLILKELGLRDDDVANIYFHGSWIQGTCTKTSDRDLIIVTRRFQLPLRFQADFDYFHEFELHKLFGKYDVCVYSIENFEELLKKNFLLGVQCLFLPNEFKLKEEIDFRQIYLDKYYDPIRIKKVAFYEMFSSLNLTNNPPSSRSTGNQSREEFVFKNLFHGIRFLDLAQQLIQFQTIKDLKSVSHMLNTMKQIRDDPTSQTNTESVLQFVRKESEELKDKLNFLVPTNMIKGIFQVEIRFDCTFNFEETFQKLKIKCENTKYKILFIHLDIDQKIKQFIVQSSYHGEYPSNSQQIQKEIHQDFQGFSIENIQIKSDLSNEGIPINDIDKQLLWYDKTFSFQFNYRFSSDPHLIQIIQQNLKSDRTFNSSIYLIQPINHKYFNYSIQISLTDVAKDKALEMNEQFINHYLKRIPRQSLKMQKGFIVYHTNHDITKTQLSPLYS